jgi:hypothetical protein
MEPAPSKMSNQMVRDFRERWQAVAAIEVEEQRSASFALRWKQTNAILQLAIGLGLSLTEMAEAEELVYHRWAILKEAQA